MGHSSRIVCHTFSPPGRAVLPVAADRNPSISARSHYPHAQTRCGIVALYCFALFVMHFASAKMRFHLQQLPSVCHWSVCKAWNGKRCAAMEEGNTAANERTLHHFRKLRITHILIKVIRSMFSPNQFPSQNHFNLVKNCHITHTHIGRPYYAHFPLLCIVCSVHMPCVRFIRAVPLSTVSFSWIRVCSQTHDRFAHNFFILNVSFSS